MVNVISPRLLLLLGLQTSRRLFDQTRGGLFQRRTRAPGAGGGGAGHGVAAWLTCVCAPAQRAGARPEAWADWAPPHPPPQNQAPGRRGRGRALAQRRPLPQRECPAVSGPAGHLRPGASWQVRSSEENSTFLELLPRTSSPDIAA